MSATITIGPLQASNNLSDISSRTAGRSNVGFIADGINLSDPTLSTQITPDGKDGYFKVVFFNNSPNVTVSGPTFTATIALNSNVLTLASGSPAWYPQPEDIGKKIAVAGAGAAGGVLLTTILSLDSGNTPESSTVVLGATAQTALSAATGTIVLWPYFEAADVGKTIWMAQGGAINYTGQTGGSTPFGCNGPYLGTVASVSAYNSFALGGNPTSACNGFTIRIVWGTDNTNAIIAGRNLQAQRGLRRINYENGSATPALCCAFNMLGSQAALDALGNTSHYGNNVTTFFTDAAGNLLRYFAVPYESWKRQPPRPAARLNAQVHLASSIAASTVLYLDQGDSMALDNPTGQSPAFSQMTRVFQRIRATNVGLKTLLEGQNFAIGGAIWQWLHGNPVASGNVAWPTLPAWYVANTANTWDQFVNAAVPTIVDLLENGGNDREYIHQPSAQAVITNILANFTRTNGLPPDIIMCNMRPWPVTSVNALPNFVDQNGQERSALLHRSMARVQNIGFLDYFDVAHLAFFGWSPARLKNRMIPGFAAGSAASASVPMGIGQPCRDYDMRVALGASQAGAAIWGQSPILWQIGYHPQNCLRFGLDSTSTYLTMRAHTWGCTAGEFGNPAPTISITNGAAALTVAAATAATVTAYTSVALDQITGGTLITTTGFAWPTACVGQMLLIPNAQFHWSGAPTGTSDFVTQIIGRPTANQILVADALPVPGVSSAGWGLSAVYAPIIFSKVMADAQADVILSDGTTTLTTKILTYTSSTQVTLAANWTGTTRATYNTGTSMFLGRLSIPQITCNGSNGTNAIYAGTALATGPNLQVAVRNDDLEVSYFPYFNTYSVTATVSITATAAILTSTTSIFEAGQVGQAIQVPGAGAAGATLQSYIKTFTSATQVTLSDNAGTTLSSVSKTISIANVSSAGGGEVYPQMVYRGAVERFGGQFLPTIIPSASLTIGQVALKNWIGVPEFYGPQMLEYEAWGTSDQDYAFGGAGGTHNNSAQSAIVDEVVLSSQNWVMASSYAGSNGAVVPTTGNTVPIPANQAFTAINPAGTLAALTVTLPSVFPQGGTVQFSISQIITALTVGAPSGFTITGTAVSSTTTTANTSFSYRLQGTVWYRVQ